MLSTGSSAQMPGSRCRAALGGGDADAEMRVQWRLRHGGINAVTHDPNWRYAEPDMVMRRAVDAGLRQHMLRVYNYMAGGLAVTGATAAFAVYSGLYATIAGTPLMWLIVLAPLAIAFFLGFRIERMSLGAAQAASGPMPF